VHCLPTNRNRNPPTSKEAIAGEAREDNIPLLDRRNRILAGPPRRRGRS
jgi:hypothetical protein